MGTPADNLHTPAYGDVNPFEPGESLTYTVEWGVFTVGQAVLTTEPAEFEGEEALRFHFSVRTTSFADAIYPVRDEIVSFVDADVTRSLHYEKDQSEGRHRRDVTVTYDWNENTAQYRNFDNVREPLPLDGPVYDPLSILFAVRHVDIPESGSFTIPLSDGRALHEAEVAVVERATIETPAGTFAAIHLAPDTGPIGGIFKKDDGATMELWVTDDAYRLPLILRSRVTVGAFEAVLTNWERPDAGAE